VKETDDSAVVLLGCPPNGGPEWLNEVVVKVDTCDVVLMLLVFVADVVNEDASGVVVVVLVCDAVPDLVVVV